MDENRIADRGRFWRRWAKSTLARNGMLSTGSLMINPTLTSGQFLSVRDTRNEIEVDTELLGIYSDTQTGAPSIIDLLPSLK